MTELTKIDQMIIQLKDEIAGTDELGYIYSKSMLKKINFEHTPLEIRFIDVDNSGFYSLNMSGETVESVFSGLIGLHGAASLDFNFFTKTMKLVSDVASHCYAIKEPLKELKLTQLNWQDAYIRYVKKDTSAHRYSFNLHGLHTIFDNKKIQYDFCPSLFEQPSFFTGCIGYFDGSQYENGHSGFVMKVQAANISMGQDVINYKFYVSLEQEHPLIIMESGHCVSEIQFKQFIETHLYKMFYDIFSKSGLEYSFKELKTLSRTEMQDLIKIHEMVKV
jgi:hypothetical protein